MSSRKPLYVSVADRIGGMIINGALRAGDRIPSIRATSRRLSVSVTTVIEAYRLLEDRGLIESRPQSGFFARDTSFARQSSPSLPPEPEIRNVPMKPVRVRVWDYLSSTLGALRPDDAVPLGGGVSSPEFLPVEELSRMLARIIRNRPDNSSRYEFAPGNERLRAAIARRAFDAGCDLSPEDVVITTGATEALTLGLRAVTKPGDAVAVESPCYFGILHLLQRLDLRAIELSTDPRHGMSVSAVEGLLASSNSVAAFVVNPSVHNPLGATMEDDQKQRIADLLKRARIPLIEDDTYGDLAFSEPRPRCIKAWDQSGDVMLCGSFSKTLAPGYRVAWIAGGKWTAAINELKLAFSLGSTTATQLAVAEYLEGRRFERHLRRMRRTYRDQLRILANAVGRYFPEGTKVTRPSGGHVLWVELPTSIDTLKLFERATAKGVSFAPGPIFSATGRYRNCLRLNVGYPWNARLEKAVRMLGELASE